MTTDYYRTPQHARWLHVWRWGVAVFLAALLALLWVAGFGPTTTSCCGSNPVAATAPVAAAPAVTAAPAVVPQGSVTTTGTLAAAKTSAMASPMASLTRVYFGWARFHVDEAAANTLAPLAAQLKSHADVRAVVSGYHDPTGDAAANTLLARNRALAVRDFLQADGVAAAQIMVQQSADTTGTGNDREARRAEVRIQ